ncbi:uncharacterized protein BCR38DRAFT_458629 [Pseudomassariella vexata]|uniref:Uncharacterized protein n=1 Tax=Pseudomassariella vexata TaxID=1141098 RepID=A0A1Y2DY15_9PEZI|nr:uncharacterized protein BCR38DRAFT_458629 [Pseudomassariella vexata]ORY63525.1 hypothetical protein BCR38DRAFT_458629 [Pseudomassariella vexata]
MLDENLPTFFNKHSPDNPLTSVVYFTQNGSEPAPEYSFRRPNPSLPQSKNKFAVALADAFSQDVIFAEVLVEPEWQQPTLSAAEIRAQNGVPPPPVPMIPEHFIIQLYNPDQQISVRGEKSTWTGKESWEFEMPQQSFRMPSASKLDQQQSDPVVSELTPKILFRWKRDSKFSKDVTCYMCGKSLGGKRSKEPDITVAMYKQGREPALTVYEPNLQRVEVEDRKGLEVVLLLGAEVIRDVYLFPNRDSFNINGTVPPNKRKNSRPIPTSSSPKLQVKPQSTATAGYAMSGGLSMMNGVNNVQPQQQQTTASPVMRQLPTPPSDARAQWEVDTETKRLQAMVAQEEREREQRDQAEAKRIKKMLDDEEKERKRRDAEVAKETERLRKEFGMQGQEYTKPNLPPRPEPNGRGPQLQPAGMFNGMQHPPPRPMSAEPPSHPGALGGWFSRPGVGPGFLMPSNSIPAMQPQAQPHHGSGRETRHSAEGGKKMPKKRSMFF